MTQVVASIIIPIALYHTAAAQRAIASATAQTVACEIIPIVDDEQRGTAWVRNRGIEQATTDFITFLDADDLLMPTFVERCWQAQQQTGRYIYTDFTDDKGRLYETPDCPWVNESWHAVTAFIPRAWVLAVDGFDEALREGGEDSEFFMHLCSSGHCGARLPEALFVYTNAPDTRSKRWVHSPAHLAYDAMIQERYLSKGKTAMGCCTEPAKKLLDPNTPAPRMVLARPRWGGNRSERGLVTGTKYPPADRSQIIEVDPRDAAARPDHWDVIRPPEPAPVNVPMIAMQPTPSLQALAQRALQIKPPPYQPPAPPPPAPIVPAMPNVERVTRLAQRLAPQGGQWHTDVSTSAEYVVPDALATDKALQQLRPNTERFTPRVPMTRTHTDDPVFVFPDKDYPSYTDVRRLVELSGFTAMTVRQAALEAPEQRLVVLSPEQPDQVGDCDPSCIWWNLEYGGDYEPDLSNWQGEAWASDPAWAKAHGAKMVVMGSHPDLNPYPGRPARPIHDVTLLGYMTPRRERIKQQLADLAWPAEDYPGYGDDRYQQLTMSRLMLHVHQRDDTHAIAPQRIALAAAYQLPLICEAVPDAGEYEHYLPFVTYDNLNGEVRSQLAMMEFGAPQARAERLRQWLCVEHTFRRCVEEALK